MPPPPPLGTASDGGHGHTRGGGAPSPPCALCPGGGSVRSGAPAAETRGRQGGGAAHVAHQIRGWGDPKGHGFGVCGAFNYCPPMSPSHPPSPPIPPITPPPSPHKVVVNGEMGWPPPESCVFKMLQMKRRPQKCPKSRKNILTPPSPPPPHPLRTPMHRPQCHAAQSGGAALPPLCLSRWFELPRAPSALCRMVHWRCDASLGQVGGSALHTAMGDVPGVGRGPPGGRSTDRVPPGQVLWGGGT